MEELSMALLGLSVILFGIAVIILIIYVLAYWLIFNKAGEAGWKALIPIYSTYTEYRLFWNKEMFALLFVLMALTAIFKDIGGIGTPIFYAASLGSTVMNIIMCVKLSLSFGHGAGFAVGLVLLNPIFLLILAFDSSTYIGPGGKRDRN